MSVEPLKNSTLPVAVPDAEATVAVSVTGDAVSVLVVELVRVVVVEPRLTTTVAAPLDAVYRSVSVAVPAGDEALGVNVVPLVNVGATPFGE
jgi:hypothetical protein